MADLFKSVAPHIARILNDIISSEMVRVLVTYKKHTGDAFDSTTRRGKATFTSYTNTPTAKISHTTKSAAMLGSKIQSGDLMYVIQASDLPDGISLKDEIIDDTKVMKILDIQWLFSFGVVLTARGENG
jgi:hypothetical protein